MHLFHIGIAMLMLHLMRGYCNKSVRDVLHASIILQTVRGNKMLIW